MCRHAVCGRSSSPADAFPLWGLWEHETAGRCERKTQDEAGAKNDDPIRIDGWKMAKGDSRVRGIPSSTEGFRVFRSQMTDQVQDGVSDPVVSFVADRMRQNVDAVLCFLSGRLLADHRQQIERLGA